MIVPVCCVGLGGCGGVRWQCGGALIERQYVGWRAGTHARGLVHSKGYAQRVRAIFWLSRRKHISSAPAH